MDYQSLNTFLPKQSHLWSCEDVKIWLQFINIASLTDVFKQHHIDGSCMHILNNTDLQEQLGITSNVIRKKLLKWLHDGLQEFDQYVKKCKASQKVLSLHRTNTFVMRHCRKSQFTSHRAQVSQKNPQMIVTTYEGQQTCFYQITQLGTAIGRSKYNGIMVAQESVDNTHAEIIYRSGSFWLADLGTAHGTFIKISKKLALSPHMMIEMGSYQFKVAQCKQKYVFLKGKCISQMEQDFLLEIDLSSVNSYNFGRKNNNNFNRDDQHMSAIHASIYMEHHQIIIEDLSSTNGTWIRLGDRFHKSQPYPLSNQIVFKIGTTLTYICKQEDHADVQKQGCYECGNIETNCVIMPCKHNIVCWECSEAIIICPLCGSKVLEKIKIFL